jgi:ferric-dicitrate binding protein FerR (iron transport regulator)
MDMQSFQDRLDDCLGGGATPPLVAELQQSLSANPRLRRALVERMLLEVHLRRAFAGSEAAQPIVMPSRSGRRAMLGEAAAAAVLLALGIGLFAYFGQKPAATENVPPSPVNEVVSGKVKIDGVAVERLPEEQWFEVASDVPAMIRLADGSAAELAPTTKARLHARREDSRPSVELSQGAGKFKVPRSGDKFRVETGVGSVTVLGTEFSVKLEPRRGEGKKSRSRLLLSVSVTEGSVTVNADGKNTVLRAGDSRVFGRKREEDDD